MTEWTSVKDRMPGRPGKYLVAKRSPFSDEYFVYIMRYDGDGGFTYYDSEYGDVYPDGVDFWAPLPEPPGIGTDNASDVTD